MATLCRIAPEIPVSNLQESIEYYERQLGFRVVMEMPAGEYAIVERDEIAIHLFRDAARPAIGLLAGVGFVLLTLRSHLGSRSRGVFTAAAPGRQQS